MNARSLQERDEIREALHVSAARESIERRLGDELISASIEVIHAWAEVRRLRIVRSPTPRMTAAINHLADLVGR